ncbi:MAG: hypothetical protein JRI93_15420, partial [Deltaproteobacteria bacterium]|nr:hypothetical protein [Deltaproteobacteria bacterium]
MSLKLRFFFMVLMITALLFGFLHLFIPGTSLYNFERLHIFLFNLCSGGTILIYYTEDRKSLSPKATAFLGLALTYALLAFLEYYLLAMLVAFILAVIVDSVRIKKFSLFPVNFFKTDVPVAEKFHQASLLCLSMGLAISGLVILNNEYLKLVSFQ